MENKELQLEKDKLFVEEKSLRTVFYRKECSGHE